MCQRRVQFVSHFGRFAGENLEGAWKTGDLGRGLADQLAVGRQSLWVLVDHCDASRAKGLHLIVINVLASEHRREETEKTAPGNPPEKGDVQQAVVNAGLRRHQEIGGVAAVGL